MKKVIYELKAKNNEIEIIPFGDSHIGNICCNEQAVIDVIEYVKAEPNRYIVLNGDLIEGNTKNSPGSIFEQEMSPTVQISWICEKLKPIAHKIINYVPGNHEYDRQIKEVGITPADIIVSTLAQNDPSIIDRFCPDGAFTFLKIGGLTYTCHTKTCLTMFNLHGTGGGTKIGAKVQKLDDMKDIVYADFYIRSHTHEFDYHTGLLYDVNKHTHDIKEKICYFINTSSFLRYNGSYGARSQMKPIPIIVPIIKLKFYREYYRKENKKRTDSMKKQVKIDTMEF